ncbi:hypothetical protein M8494_29055 [Serratia ureilytica]
MHVTYRPLSAQDTAITTSRRTFALVSAPGADGEPVPMGGDRRTVRRRRRGGGYLNRPELTAERFLDDPFNRRRCACIVPAICALCAGWRYRIPGRNDQQVKSRFPHRMRQVEAQLSTDPRAQRSRGRD